MPTQYFESRIDQRGTMGFSGCDISLVIRVPAYKVAGSQEQTAEKVYRLGTLQTISISTYNAKTPVKALGFKNPISIARGGRTIAGTMILNQMHSHVFDENNYGPGGWMKYDDDGFLTYSSGNVEYFISRTNEVKKIASESKAKLEKQAEKGEIPRNEGETDVEAIKRLTQLKGREIDKAKKQWDYSWDTSLLGQRTKPSDLPPFDIIIMLLNEAGNAGKVILYGVEIVHDSQTLSVEDIYTEVQYQYIARDIEYFENMDVLNGFSKNNAIALAEEVARPDFSNDDINALAFKNITAGTASTAPGVPAEQIAGTSPIVQGLAPGVQNQVGTSGPANPTAVQIQQNSTSGSIPSDRARDAAQGRAQPSSYSYDRIDTLNPTRETLREYLDRKDTSIKWDEASLKLPPSTPPPQRQRNRTRRR